jgi:hypothetical protein
LRASRLHITKQLLQRTNQRHAEHNKVRHVTCRKTSLGEYMPQMREAFIDHSSLVRTPQHTMEPRACLILLPTRAAHVFDFDISLRDDEHNAIAQPYKRRKATGARDRTLRYHKVRGSLRPRSNNTVGCVAIADGQLRRCATTQTASNMTHRANHLAILPIGR